MINFEGFQSEKHTALIVKAKRDYMGFYFLDQSPLVSDAVAELLYAPATRVNVIRVSWVCEDNKFSIEKRVSDCQVDTSDVLKDVLIELSTRIQPLTYYSEHHAYTTKLIKREQCWLCDEFGLNLVLYPCLGNRALVAQHADSSLDLEDSLTSNDRIPSSLSPNVLTKSKPKTLLGKLIADAPILTPNGLVPTKSKAPPKAPEVDTTTNPLGYDLFAWLKTALVDQALHHPEWSSIPVTQTQFDLANGAAQYAVALPPSRELIMENFVQDVQADWQKSVNVINSTVEWTVAVISRNPPRTYTDGVNAWAHFVTANGYEIKADIRRVKIQSAAQWAQWESMEVTSFGSSDIAMLRSPTGYKVTLTIPAVTPSAIQYGKYEEHANTVWINGPQQVLGDLIRGADGIFAWNSDKWIRLEPDTATPVSEASVRPPQPRKRVPLRKTSHGS